VPIGKATGDLLHRFYDQQEQIDGGLMDKFAAYSDARGLAMGFYDGSQTKLWEYARRYTLADHFFHAAFGGSFLNHFWMICACTPRYESAPDVIKAKFDGQRSPVPTRENGRDTNRSRYAGRIRGEHDVRAVRASPRQPATAA
jgi:acid phosphatase